MKVDDGMGEVVPAQNRRAHGPWSDLALHTIGWRADLPRDFSSIYD